MVFGCVAMLAWAKVVIPTFLVYDALQKMYRSKYTPCAVSHSEAFEYRKEPTEGKGGGQNKT